MSTMVSLGVRKVIAVALIAVAKIAIPIVARL
jgi:hypothetical protein